jgi:hypothetical protein
VAEPTRESIRTSNKTNIYFVKKLYTPTIKKFKERSWVRSPINLSINTERAPLPQYDSIRDSLANIVNSNKFAGSKPDREGVFF